MIQITIEELKGMCAMIETSFGTCWVFPHVNKRGYGVVTRKGIREYAHRAAIFLTKGPIPKGAHSDHLCRNLPCCNPEHLEVVDPRENLLRGVGVSAINSRKTHCKRGHEFTPENTRLKEGGRHRSCEACRRERKKDPVVRARMMESDRRFKNKHREKIRLANNARRLANRDSIVANSRVRYAANREAACLAARQWRMDNPDKAREVQRKSNEKNKEKRDAYAKAYRLAHREDRAAKQREYVARKKAERLAMEQAAHQG